MELQDNLAVFRELDAEIVAIAQEESDASALTRAEAFVKNGFPMVADPQKVSRRAIERFSVYLVDKTGTIRVFLKGTKTARPRLDRILTELARINGTQPPEMKRVDGKVVVEKPGGRSDEKANMEEGAEVLSVRWMWSHDRVRPGDAFKLAFCPVIAEGYHVYASREKKMTPFRVEFQFPKGIELVSPLMYPKAEVIDDPVVKLALAVYRKDIPISTLHLKASEDLAPGELTVTATITYQACSETACFPPAVVVKELKLKVDEKDKKRQEVYGWGSW